MGDHRAGSSPASGICIGAGLSPSRLRRRSSFRMQDSEEQPSPKDSTGVSEGAMPILDSSFCWSYHSGNGESGHSRRNATTALGALLARAENDAGGNARADAAQRLYSETQSLVSWAKENDWLLDREKFRSLVKDLPELGGGLEHSVFGSVETGRVLKITCPPYFGSRSSLAEYLKNALWSNALFQDDIKLVGVLESENGVSVVTSQPFIEGRSPTKDEITQWFGKQGFVIDGYNKWKNPGTGAVIADTHEGNFIVTDSDVLVPIDLQVLTPDDATLKGL